MKKFISTWPTIKSARTHGGTRTPNLRFRRPTPYPLGHAGTVVQYSSNVMRDLARQPEREKIGLRRPGIEPGSQEWESCMIPLHQRRSDIPVWIFEKSTNLPKEFCQLCTTLDGLLPASLLVESSFLCTHSPASSVGRA